MYLWWCIIQNICWSSHLVHHSLFASAWPAYFSLSLFLSLAPPPRDQRLITHWILHRSQTQTQIFLSENTVPHNPWITTPVTVCVRASVCTCVYPLACIHDLIIKLCSFVVERIICRKSCRFCDPVVYLIFNSYSTSYMWLYVYSCKRADGMWIHPPAPVVKRSINVVLCSTISNHNVIIRVITSYGFPKKFCCTLWRPTQTSSDDLQ